MFKKSRTDIPYREGVYFHFHSEPMRRASDYSDLFVMTAQA